MKWKGSCGRTDEDGSIPSLMRLCLLSLADNMKEVWVKDYADNYLDQYSFRHIMGPFNFLRESVRVYQQSAIELTEKSHMPAPTFSVGQQHTAVFENDSK